ncbi:MAG: hypothetical protein M9962_04070 [Oligoflexia bacterium]|nr:hypothetical protein [Oligoflexia bacterium]
MKIIQLQIGFLFAISMVLISTAMAADGGETTLYVGGDGEGSRPGEPSVQAQLIDAIYKAKKKEQEITRGVPIPKFREDSAVVQDEAIAEKIPTPQFRPDYKPEESVVSGLDDKNVPAPQFKPENWEEIVAKAKAAEAAENAKKQEELVAEEEAPKVKKAADKKPATYKDGLDLKGRLANYLAIVKRLENDLEKMNTKVGSKTTLESCAPMHGNKLKEVLDPAKTELKAHAKRVSAAINELDKTMKDSAASASISGGAVCGKEIAKQLSNSLEQPISGGLSKAELRLKSEYNFLVKIDKQLDEKHSKILYLYNSPDKQECLTGQNAYLDGRVQYKKLQSDLVSMMSGLKAEKTTIHSFVVEVSKTQSCEKVASN